MSSPVSTPNPVKNGTRSRSDRRPPWGGGRPTVAGHAHHAGFHLDMSSAWLRGDRESRDWDASWQVKTVDEPAWAALRRRLRQQYAGLLDAIEKEPAANGVELATTVGAIAHAAYHLGAIRQSIASR